jgi:hypothetical protein
MEMAAAESARSSIWRDMVDGLRLFLSLFWDHRWPKESKRERAVYIAAGLWMFVIIGFAWYWFTH